MRIEGEGWRKDGIGMSNEYRRRGRRRDG